MLPRSGTPSWPVSGLKSTEVSICQSGTALGGAGPFPAPHHILNVTSVSEKSIAAAASVRNRAAGEVIMISKWVIWSG